MASFINRLSFFARSMGSSASSIAGTSSSTTMSAKVQQLVESSIESNFIVVFSKSWCSYSRRAKQLISSLDLPKGKTVQVFEYVFNLRNNEKILTSGLYDRLDRRDDGYAIQSYLEEKTGQSTVPNIFISKQTNSIPWVGYSG